MALQDHFHPSLGFRRHWHAFHNSWATYISSDLNRRLPQGYFAEANVQFGIEIDVAAFEEPGQAALAQGEWVPPQPSLTIPLTIVTDTVEVMIFHAEGGPVLAGAIELVSPANKDRPANRDAFVSKCASYVQQGVGLVMVDVVTDRGANLHQELMARLQQLNALPLHGDLYATAYRPVLRDGLPQLDIWQDILALGRSQPTMPLWLRGGICLPVELEASYERTCQERRIPVNGA